MIFGPKRLPQFGKAIGDTVREMRGVKKQLEDLHSEGEDVVESLKR